MEDFGVAAVAVPQTETPRTADDVSDVPLGGLHDKVLELLSADSGADGSGQGDKLISSAAGTTQASFPQPQLASWYVPGKVHAVEKRALPEFFLGRFASKTPANYIQIRDAMIGAWRRAPSRYVTSTSLRRHLRGDACALLRVHTFLEHWGLINYGVDAEARPQPSAPPTPAPVTDSLRRRVIASRVHLEEATGGPAAKRRRSNVAPGRSTPGTVGDGSTAADLSGSDDEDEMVGLEVGLAGGSAGPPLFADDGRLLSADDTASDAAGVDAGDVGGPGEAPAIEYHCDECGADCSRTRFHCATRADMDLCARCHAARRYPRSMQARDFIQMTGGVAAASSRSGGSSAAWTDSETLLLLEALELYGDRWELVAEHVGSKTKDACVAHFLRIPIEDAFLGDEGTSRWWPGSGTTPRQSPTKTVRDAAAGAESLASHPLLGKSVLNTAIAALGAWGRPRQSGKPLPFLSSKGLPSREDLVMVRAAFLAGAIRSPSAMAAFAAAQSSLSLVNASQRPPQLPWMTAAVGDSPHNQVSGKTDRVDEASKRLGASDGLEESLAGGRDGGMRTPAPVSILSSEDGLAAAEAALWAACASLGVDKSDDDAATGRREVSTRSARATDASAVVRSPSAAVGSPGAEAMPSGSSSGLTVGMASEQQLQQQQEQQQHEQQQQLGAQDGLDPDVSTSDAVEYGVADDGVTPMKRATHIAARRRGVRALKDGTADKPSVDAIAGVVLAVAAVRARELVDAETVNIKAFNERALEAQLEVLDAKVAHIRWYDALSQLIDQKARRDHATEFLTGVAHASARVTGEPTDGSDLTCIPESIRSQFTATLHRRALSADDCVPRVSVVPCAAGSASNVYVGPPTKDHSVPDTFFAVHPTPLPSVYATEPVAPGEFTAATAGSTSETASRVPEVAVASPALASAVESVGMDISPAKPAPPTSAVSPATRGQPLPVAGASQLSVSHVPQARAPVVTASATSLASPSNEAAASSSAQPNLPLQPLGTSQAPLMQAPRSTAAVESNVDHLPVVLESGTGSLDAALAGRSRGVDAGVGTMGYDAAAGTVPSMGPPPLPVGTPAPGTFHPNSGQAGLPREPPPTLPMGSAPAPGIVPPRELLQEGELSFGAGSLGAPQPPRVRPHPQPPQAPDAQPRSGPLPGVGMVPPQPQTHGPTPSAEGMAWSMPSVPSGAPPGVDAASFLGVTQDNPGGSMSLPHHSTPVGGDLFSVPPGGADPRGAAAAAPAPSVADADAILSAMAVSAGMSFGQTGGGVPRNGDGPAAVGGGGGGGFYPPVSVPGGTIGPAGGTGAYPPVSMSGDGDGYPPVSMGGDGAGYLAGSVPASDGIPPAGGGGGQGGAPLAGGADGGLQWPPADGGGAYLPPADPFLPLGGGSGVEAAAAATDGTGAPPHPPPGLPFPAPGVPGAPPG
ncbi:hypothetical protein MMPV_002815 [Pyropia vietnamensis]